MIQVKQIKMFNKNLGTYSGPILLASVVMISTAIIPFFILDTHLQEKSLNNYFDYAFILILLWIIMFLICGLDLAHECGRLEKKIKMVSFYILLLSIAGGLLLHYLNFDRYYIICMCIAFSLIYTQAGFNCYIQFKNDFKK